MPGTNRRDIVGQFGRLRIVPPQLLAQAIGKTCALLLQFVGDARPLAQLDHHWIVTCKLTEGFPIGAQRACENTGIAAVILGAGHREAVTEAVELLRIDGKDQKPMLEQHLNHWAMRRLDRHGDLSRRGFGFLKQPITQFCQPGSAMRELALTHLSSFGIKQANAMALRRPVDPDEPLHIVDHGGDLLVLEAGHRDPDRSLYWRSRRNDLLLDLDRGRSAGARFLRRCSGTGGQGCSRQIGPCGQSNIVGLAPNG